MWILKAREGEYMPSYLRTRHRLRNRVGVLVVLLLGDFTWFPFFSFSWEGMLHQSGCRSVSVSCLQCWQIPKSHSFPMAGDSRFGCHLNTTQASHLQQLFLSSSKPQLHLSPGGSHSAIRVVAPSEKQGFHSFCVENRWWSSGSWNSSHPVCVQEEGMRWSSSEFWKGCAFWTCCYTDVMSGGSEIKIDILRYTSNTWCRTMLFLS